MSGAIEPRGAADPTSAEAEGGLRVCVYLATGVTETSNARPRCQADQH